MNQEKDPEELLEDAYLSPGGDWSWILQKTMPDSDRRVLLQIQIITANRCRNQAIIFSWANGEHP